MPPAPGHTGMPRVTAGKLIGHIITIPTHTPVETQPKQEKRRASAPHLQFRWPCRCLVCGRRGFVFVVARLYPSPAKVSDSRWGCGPIKRRLFGLMNVPVWWAWREAQVSRGNVLPTAVAVNKSKHTEERSAVPQHSGEAVCLCPVSKLSSSLTCLSLSPFLQQPYKHWQLCSSGNEYDGTDWLGAPHSSPDFAWQPEEMKPLPSARK